jgi:hypothetical protein
MTHDAKPGLQQEGTLTSYQKSKPASQHEAAPAPWEI